jgi:hypothetical protein
MVHGCLKPLARRRYGIKKEEKPREELLANVAKKNVPRSSNFPTS